MSNRGALQKVEQQLVRETRLPDATPEEKTIAAISAKVLGLILAGQDVESAKQVELSTEDNPTIRSAVIGIVDEYMASYPLS